ncbi:MAG TPA: hypothetical protein VM285_01350 [Polyangia bacterium]|nr:hypothetical protein [Polyangia bacterium]
MAQHDDQEYVDPEVVTENAPATIPDDLKRYMQPATFNREQAMARFEHQVEIMHAIRKAALQALNPKDFVRMGSDESAMFYLQNYGAQRLKPMAELRYPQGQQPKCERVSLPDKQFGFIYTGYVASMTTGSVDFVIGGRSSTERFFDKFDDEGNRLPVNELDVQKAAWANWENRAVSGALGLRGLTAEDLKQHGFDVSRARGVTFQGGGQGGAGAGGKLTIPFGKHKGKALDDESVPVDDLRWLAKTIGESIRDPEKAKWKKRNETLLSAIKAEGQRRNAPGEPAGDDEGGES